MRMPSHRRFLLGLSLTAALLAVAFAIMLAVLMGGRTLMAYLGLSQAAIGIAGGCVCCGFGDDLLETLRGLCDAPQPFDHIVIETRFFN